MKDWRELQYGREDTARREHPRPTATGGRPGEPGGARGRPVTDGGGRNGGENEGGGRATGTGRRDGGYFRLFS